MEPSSKDQKFVIYGYRDDHGVLVHIDFADLHERPCMCIFVCEQCAVCDIVVLCYCLCADCFSILFLLLYCVFVWLL